MQIVINISKKLYDRYKEKDHIKRCDIDEFEKALDRCIILPKGHGRLGDLTALYKALKKPQTYYAHTLGISHPELDCDSVASGIAIAKLYIDNAPTIIKADKAKSEG